MRNEEQSLIIKNMVCPRCIQAVKAVFEELGHPISNVKLGEVVVAKLISPAQKVQLEQHLKEQGFELLDNKQTQLITAIKSIIIQEIHYKNEPSPVNFSVLLTDQLHYDYAYLSRLFSSVEGRTIEKFILAQKTEKIKELLTYDELNLSEIAFQMNYSSSAHLSAQFKKITGMSPTEFKKLQIQKRRPLDEV